jgi:hypothetical protein
MKEEALLELLKKVSNGQTSADEALAELLELGSKSYARDVTNKVFVAGVNLHVDCTYGCEYTSR